MPSGRGRNSEENYLICTLYTWRSFSAPHFSSFPVIPSTKPERKTHPKTVPKTAKNSPTPDIPNEKPPLNFQFNLPPTPEVIPQRVSWWKRPSLTDWIMVGLTFSYVAVNVLILLTIKKQAQIAADSLTEFRKQVTSTESQFSQQLKVMSEQAHSTQASAIVKQPKTLPARFLLSNVPG